MKKILFLLSMLALVSVSAKKEKLTTVEMLTSKGKIVLRLYNETPLHRDNFVKLAKKGYFNDLLFHRVIEDFMIQGGDPDSRDAAPDAHLGEGGPGYTIEAEFRFPKLYHKRGVLAAAREGDNVNPEKRSAGSQFYIVWGRTFTRDEINRIADQVERNSGGTLTFPDELKQYYLHHPGTPHLDGSYTVFGEVVKGIEVVNAIQQAPTDRNDRPLEDIKILSVSVK
ncbi:MAG: peptidylprolyl isomerase [Prevotellaceae bacterium]|nr:peptidylprolyl isomerase [Prevotellaceae bacterium]